MEWTRQPGLAYWATARQLRRAGLYGDKGLILGTAYGRLLRHNGPEHTLCVASTQSGKTTNFVYPNALSMLSRSMFFHDPKEEIYPATALWRGSFSRVIRLAPTSPTSARYNLLDPLADALGTDQEHRMAQLVGEMLTDPDSQGSDQRSDAGRHFGEMAAEAVGGIALYGLYTQRARSLAAINALLRSVGLVPLLKAMRRYPHAGIQGAAGLLLETDGQNERSGIRSTLGRALRLYSDPLIARATDSSDFALRDLRERAQPMSLYLCVPFGDEERLRPWVRNMVGLLLDYCTSRKEGWTWPVDAIIDEVPSLRRMVRLQNGLDHYAGFGVRLTLITPSMKRLEEIYGTKHNFLDGCKVQLVFGITDAKVRQIFSDNIGDTEVKRQRQTGRGQWVTERIKEPLLSATTLKHIGDDQVLAIIGKRQVLATKTYYKDNPVWLERSRYV
jgi:type IV secretion system protein VirD4